MTSMRLTFATASMSIGLCAFYGLSGLSAQDAPAPIPTPATSAQLTPFSTLSPTPTPTLPPTPLQGSTQPESTPTATPLTTPAPKATPEAGMESAPMPTPVTESTMGIPLDTAKAAADAIPSPTPDPLETTLSPQALGLPDVLKDEPYIPQDLLNPIPRPPTTADHDTVKASEETLKKLRAAAQKADPPSDAPKMSIGEAVNFALSNNPDVLNAVEQIRLIQGQVISVRAQALPQLTAQSSYQYQQQSLVGQGSGPTVVPITPDFNLTFPGSRAPQNEQWSLQVAASQLLFDGGGAISAIRAAKMVQDATYFQLRQTIDRVISEVKINFYQIVLNRALIIAQEQSVALLESQLQDQINRFEAGTVPRFNVLQAEVALANAIPPLIQARNNLRISQFQLVRLLGKNYDQTDPSQVPFNVVGNLEFAFRSIHTDESIRTALIRSPFLKAQRQNILSQASNVNVQLAGYFPRISMSGGYQVGNDMGAQDLGQVMEGWFFGFTGTWNIFDGLETAGNVRQAKAQLMQAKINYDDGVRSVILSVQEAISNLQQARETIDSQQASVAQALEALRLARERLDAGAGTQLDVLNAQVQLLEAQTTELQARFSYIQALAQYDAALSLDTEWEEAFDDPLAKPEKRRFIQVTSPERAQPTLPRAFRNQDPLSQILDPGGPSPTPQPTPSR